MRRNSHAIWLLLGCSHPEPVVAVTGIVTVLSISAGRGPYRAALMATAVLCGQLFVGWTNDLLDADLDAASGRTESRWQMVRYRGRRCEMQPW